MANVHQWNRAVFETDQMVRQALERLSGAGVGPDQIEVRSSIPLPHDVLPAGTRLHSRVPLMAILGGVLGGTGAFLLTSLTSLAYPLPTGGMSIVALPPAGIITFEGTAIGAILFTVATVVFECGLGKPGPLPDETDAEVAAGKVVVAVRSDATVPADWPRGGRLVD